MVMNKGALLSLRCLLARAAMKVALCVFSGACALSTAAYASPTGGTDDLPAPRLIVEGGVTFEVEFDPNAIWFDAIDLNGGVVENHVCEAIDMVFEPAAGVPDGVSGVYAIDDGPWLPLLEATDGSAVLDVAFPTGDIDGTSIVVVLESRDEPPPTGAGTGDGGGESAKPKLLIKPKKDCDG